MTAEYPSEVCVATLTCVCMSFMQGVRSLYHVPPHSHTRHHVGDDKMAAIPTVLFLLILLLSLRLLVFLLIQYWQQTIKLVQSPK